MIKRLLAVAREEENSGAVAIQALWRGHEVRKKAKAKHHYNKEFLTILYVPVSGAGISTPWVQPV